MADIKVEFYILLIMPQCKYCNGNYANQGGLTRHLNVCPERQLSIKRENDKILIAETKELYRKEKQEAMDREKHLCEIIAKQKQSPTVINNFTNCTFNIVITQQYIVKHNQTINTFCTKLTRALADKKWTSLPQVTAGMKQLTNDIKQDNDDSRKMLEYLRSTDIEIDVQDEKVDGQAVVNNLRDKIDEVDKQMVLFAKRNLSTADQAALDKQLEKDSIWTLK